MYLLLPVFCSVKYTKSREKKNSLCAYPYLVNKADSESRELTCHCGYEATALLAIILWLVCYFPCNNMKHLEIFRVFSYPLNISCQLSQVKLPPP